MTNNIKDKMNQRGLPCTRKGEGTNQIGTTSSTARPRSTTASGVETTPLYPLGPYAYWRDADGCDDYWQIGTADGQILATITFWDDDPDWTARSEATAQLLAAAPELLDALRKLLDAVSGLPAAILNVPFYEAEYHARTLVMQMDEHD